MADSIKSQNEKILAHLMKGYRLTHLIAEDLFNCLRLGARIYDLRKPRLGSHPIRSRLIKLPSGKHIAEYWYDFSVKPGTLQHEMAEAA